MSDAADLPRKRVDEDWKARIEQEAHRAGGLPAAPSAAQAGAAPQPSAAEPPRRTPPGSPPHPQLEMLVSSLSMQALMALGEIPHPETGQPELHPEEAKSLIDILGMLEEKTRGNLTPEETRLLGDTLYQLRLRFVEKTQSPGGGT